MSEGSAPAARSFVPKWGWHRKRWAPKPTWDNELIWASRWKRIVLQSAWNVIISIPDQLLIVENDLSAGDFIIMWKED